MGGAEPVKNICIDHLRLSATSTRAFITFDKTQFVSNAGNEFLRCRISVFEYAENISGMGCECQCSAFATCFIENACAPTKPTVFHVGLRFDNKVHQL